MVATRFATSIVGYFRHWRYQPSMVLILFAFMYLGWVALGGGLEDRSAPALLRVAIGWAASTAVLLAIFLINDAADCEGDRLAHPERPIPRGLADWRDVLAFGVLLLALAVGLSALVGRLPAIVSVLMAIGALFHYGYLKSRSPIPSELLNPAVSVLFPAYALSVSGDFERATAIHLLGFIYFADFAQDLLGGIHDREGDQRANVRTFARAIGARATLVVSAVALIVAIACGLRLGLGGALGRTYLVAFGVLTSVLAYRYLRLFRSSPEALVVEAGRVNHLGGGYFFLVSASTFLDHLVRPWVG